MIGFISLYSCRSTECLLSSYKKSNRFTEDIYNQYSNESIEISMDFYRMYSDTNSYKLNDTVFNEDTALIQRLFNAHIQTNNFVYHIQNKSNQSFLEISGTLYYLPNIQLSDTIYHQQEQGSYIYNIYSKSSEKGSVIQLFRMHKRALTKEINNNFNSECDYMGTNILFDDYYKVVKNNEIYLKNKNRHKHPVIWDDKMINEVVNNQLLPQINIPDLNDLGKTIRIEISKQLKSYIRRKELFLSIYKESSLKMDGNKDPIKKYSIDNHNFKFISTPAIGNCYLLISDNNDNTYVILYLCNL